MAFHKKNILPWVVCMLLMSVSAISSAAVPDSLGIVRTDEGTFIRHKVEKGDTWYAVARRYGITFVELRMANRDASEILKAGQIVLVPSRSKPTDPRNQKNYSNAPAGEPSPRPAVKGRHTVGAGETVYSIARRYGVKPADIISWNGLSSDASISVGQSLIVEGSGKAFSPEIEPPMVKDAAPISQKPRAEPKNTSAPVTTISPPPSRTVDPAAETELPTPLSGYVFSGSRKQVSETGLASVIAEEEINTSKYYALHRTAPLGTVIKVTAAKNSKSVFVKVVGTLPDSGENEGVVIKISQAGVEQLGMRDGLFAVELLYGVSNK